MAEGEAVRSDEFWTIKQEILDDLRENLVRDLQQDRLFAFLRAKRVLDEEDCEEIIAERTMRKKNEKFLDILRRRGQTGFDYFCEAFLVSKTQLHLLNELLDAFEDKIYTNEVQLLPLPQREHEVLNMELLNQNLPRPGEPGAPCLPSVTSFVHCQGNLFELTDGVPVHSAVVDNVAANFPHMPPPPPYSER